MAPQSPCAIVAANAPAADTLAVAVSAPVDRSRVPIPSSGAERLVFAQLYETLIDVDCEGHVRPGLARSWTFDDTRTRVTLVIRDGARFWSGKPVVAADVSAAWRATAGQTTAAADLARRMADAVTIVDDRTLTISLPDTSWRVLADPALAVYVPQPGSVWPEGSSRYRVADSTGETGARQLLLAPDAPAAGPYLSIRPLRSDDARDAIDRGVDVLVADDPLVVSYAQTRAELTALPLPWSRTYLFAIPRFLRIDEQSMRSLTGDTASALRAALARDAVRADARAAEAPYWWNGTEACQPAPAGGLPRNTTEQRPLRIAYDSRDRVARGLADRLAALEPRAVAVPLPPDEFARALRDGIEPAYVIAVPRSPLGACQAMLELAARAPWMHPAGGDAPLPAAPRLIPLVETRARAIVNRARVSALVDWDGTLRFGGAGQP